MIDESKKCMQRHDNKHDHKYERAHQLIMSIESRADEIEQEWQWGEMNDPRCIDEWLYDDPGFEIAATALIKAVYARPALMRTLLSEDDADAFESAIKNRIYAVAENEAKHGDDE